MATRLEEKGTGDTKHGASTQLWGSSRAGGGPSSVGTEGGGGFTWRS